MFEKRMGGKILDYDQLIYKPCIVNHICEKLNRDTEIKYYEKKGILKYKCILKS
jgi:hypothetical protein